MSSISLSRLRASSDTETNFKTRLNELAALAPPSVRGTDPDDRSVEDLLRFVVLSAALRRDLSGARAVAERRLSELLFAPEPANGRFAGHPPKIQEDRRQSGTQDRAGGGTTPEGLSQACHGAKAGHPSTLYHIYPKRRGGLRF